MNDLLFGAENVHLKVLKNTLLFGVLFGRKRRRRICPFKSCKTTLLLGVLFGRKRRGGFRGGLGGRKIGGGIRRNNLGRIFFVFLQHSNGKYILIKIFKIKKVSI
jgi:hypothetical protein